MPVSVPAGGRWTGRSSIGVKAAPSCCTGMSPTGRSPCRPVVHWNSGGYWICVVTRDDCAASGLYSQKPMS
jgi:hypothetical protein